MLKKNKIYAAVLFALGLAAIAAVTPVRTLAQYASPVNVSNLKGGAAWTRDAELGARNRFAFFQSVIAKFQDSSICAIYTVPAGNVAVIEQVGAQGAIPVAGGVMDVDLEITTNGVLMSHVYPMTNVGAFNGNPDFWTAEMPVHLYADPATIVGVCVNRVGGSGNMNISGSLSGYLVTP